MTAKENKKIKIIFWGTSEFAIPALTALLNAEYSIAAIVTAPDKPAGRKQILTPPPVKAWVMKHEAWSTIPILQPEKLSDTQITYHITNIKPDIFIIAAYGKIIPADILAIPKYGALNIHPSLLPQWRGPSPIQYAILNGDTETGATIMQIDTKIDHGPILAQRELGISNFKFLQPWADPPLAEISKTTYSELRDALAKLGAEILTETLPKYLAGEIMPMPQNESQATYSKILKKDDGHIDWSRPAEEIERMVRALNPWPGAYAFWQRNEKKLKIDILKAQIAKNEEQKVKTGTAILENRKLLVQTGNGLLEIIELQLEGKKPTIAQSFLNGYPDIIGQVLT